MKRRAAWILLAAALVTGCGEPPEAGPTRLVVAPLLDAPTGGALPPPGSPPVGIWIADVEKSWTIVRDGGAPQTGRARLEIRLEVREEEGQRGARLGIQVQEVDGVAGRYVSAYDGLCLTFRYGPQGRPDANTVRYEGEAPADAGSFLKGLWLGGLGLGTPWIPGRPMRVGGSWEREDLGDAAGLAAPPGGTVALEGGGRLAAVEDEGGPRRLVVELDTLVETDVRQPTEAIRLGVHDRGVATLRAADGLPVAWTLTEEARLRRTTDDEADSLDVRLEVRGRLRPGRPEAEEPVRPPGPPSR